MKFKKRLVGLMLTAALTTFPIALASCFGEKPADSASSSTSSTESSGVENNYGAVGVYYATNAQGGEYLLTLNEDSFSLIFGAEMVAGEYLYDGATLKLTAADGTELTANVVDGVIELTVDGEAYRFVKNISEKVCHKR